METTAKARSFLAAAGVCVALCPTLSWGQPIELAGPNCALTIPPNPAAKTSLPGTAMAVYPPDVQKPYTGCRITWWFVADELLWRATILFDGGRPAAYSLAKFDGGRTRETRCRYDGKVVVARFDLGGGAETSCPAADTLELSD